MQAVTEKLGGRAGTGEVRDGYRWVEQACPICERPATKFVGTRGGAAHRAGLGVECQVWQCHSCGLIFPNPMPLPVGGIEQHYALEPGDYFRNHEETGKVASAKQMLREAARLAGGTGRLLDIGAGRGELLAAARALGWEAVGIEPSPTFAEHAAKFSGAEVRPDPVERCNFPADSFDAVILSAVLEHLYNPDETIREVARILRRGGVLFVDVPNETGLYFRAGNLYQKLRRRGWSVNLAPTFEPFHVFGFSPRSLGALLSKHGLEIRVRHVYAGRAVLPRKPGVFGALEHLMAHAVTAVSNVGSLGTYVEVWAVKS